MKRPLAKRKYLPILVGALICLALLTLFLIWVNGSTTRRVKGVALKTAIQDCTARRLGSHICSNLEVEASPPAVFGRDYWLVYVFSTDKRQFSASMVVDASWTHATVKEYANEAK